MGSFSSLNTPMLTYLLYEERGYIEDVFFFYDVQVYVLTFASFASLGGVVDELTGSIYQ